MVPTPVKLSEEQVRDILVLRDRLRDRVAELQEDLEMTQLNIIALDSALMQSSFTKASEYPPGGASQPAGQSAGPGTATRASGSSGGDSTGPAPESSGPPPRPITTADGTVLGEIRTSPDRITVTLDQKISVSEETPPFRTFFISRIIGGMKRKDSQEVEAGGLPPGSAIECTVESEDGRIREITVTNYRLEERAKEISSTLKWALSRMLEHAG